MIKKIVSMILVFGLIASTVATTALASSKQKNKGWMSPGQIKKYYNDIEQRFSWAERAIERMSAKGLIKGYGNGSFAPQKPVSQLETIIMALRIMGWEDESKEVHTLPKKYKGQGVDDWAVGYVTIAYEKGILDEVDMMYFNPNTPAKRHEVAKYVIRALGYEEEAQDHMDEELDFIDAAATPLGSVGYVYLIDDLGIMQGDDKDRFNPMGSLTRAEMAVLFSRLDNKVDSDIDEEITGVVYDIDDDVIEIKVDGEYESYDISEDVIVYEDDERIDYDDIDTGDKVSLEISDDEVVYIELIDEDEDDGDDEKIISKFTGEVIKLENNNVKKIGVEIKHMTIYFTVAKDVEVEFRNISGKFSDIKRGDIVTITVGRDKKAREIKVHRKLEIISEEDDEDEDEYEVPKVYGFVRGNEIILEWDTINDRDLEGYKVVASKNTMNPVYPKDGYVYWITDKDKTRVEIDEDVKCHDADFGKYLEEGESYYFSVTAVYKDKKVAGNSVRLTLP